jgi:maltooligosyltrehalose trehalohydrolase
MEEQYGSKQPFLFFTDYHDELADAVREGRRREFAKFSAFTDEKRRAQIPDPNAASTFEMSSPSGNREGRPEENEWLHFYRSALAVRAKLITPRLKDAKARGATVLADKAITARWRLGDGETLTIALNLGGESVALGEIPPGKIIFETPARAQDRVKRGELGEHTFVAWLTGEVNDYATAHDARRFEPTTTEGQAS